MITREQARTACLLGWNIRCNVCGDYGATWMEGERPGWGALAVCPTHRDALKALKERHRIELAAARQINFEQEPERGGER